jgi:hypothetical protein
MELATSFVISIGSAYALPLLPTPCPLKKLLFRDPVAMRSMP